MIENLFIIGNGFDIAHGLNTGYYDFYRYLSDSKESDEVALLDFLINYTELNDLEVYLWKDFENKLGTADFERLLEIPTEYIEDVENDIEKDPDYYGSQVQMKLWECEKIAESLPEIFARWISTINVKSAERKKDFENLLIEDKNNFFLTFNYTKTLEEIYGINEGHICHIHGFVDENIMVGHGKKYKEYYNFYHTDKMITDMTSIDTIEDCVNITHNMYNYWRKDVESNLNLHQGLFDAMKDVKNIYTYGFSFNNVDMPYVKKIISKNKKSDINWWFNSFDENSIHEWKQKIADMGFKGKFNIFSINS